MYPLLKLSGTLATWKERYCEADFDSCARYQRLLRGESVPRDMMPNGVLLSERRIKL